MKRLDIRAVLANPADRRRMMVGVVVATQAREGIATTAAQAEAAYDKARAKPVPVATSLPAKKPGR